MNHNANAIRADQLDRLEQFLRPDQVVVQQLRRRVLEAYISGLSPEAIVTVIILEGPSLEELEEAGGMATSDGLGA